MSDSVLLTDKDELNRLETSSLHSPTEHIPEDVNRFTAAQNSSLLSILQRLGLYWRRILSNKIRLIFTLIFTSMLNITTRITCFTRQRTPAPSSLHALEDDSSKSLLFVDQPIDLSSIQNSKMAHILVHQPSHRTPSISIRRSAQKDSTLPMAHSVDERLFLQDSTRLLNLWTKFASEPNLFKHYSQTANTNGHSPKSSDFVSNLYLQLNQAEQDENHQSLDEIFYLNCDKLQPVSTTSTEDLNSTKTDNIVPIPCASSEEVTTTIIDDSKSQQIDEDALLDASPTINGTDTTGERHFRRRRRRSSLTRSSFSLDDTQSIADFLTKSDPNQQQQQQQSTEGTGKVESVQPDHQPKMDMSETTPSTIGTSSSNEESDQTVMDDEKPASLSRYRGRRLRHRFYRQSASVTSPQDLNDGSSPQFYLSNEALDVESSRIHSPSPSSPVTLSPLPSPTSSIPIVISNQTSSSPLTSGLKRVNSVGTNKKNVRFADSIGRELTQVQYIHSLQTDESRELSILLGSSLLSSSPPAFTKNHLYMSNNSRLEHKPWSFDVSVPAKKPTNDTAMPRRFFCLYRQPNSEHPDIYLHEVWKSQIKLEHADIPLRCSSTGAQQLLGSLWVTNASFCKYVSVKYTFNRWLNTCEREAQYSCHSNDFRNIDQFHFTIDLPVDVDRIDFILRYCVNGQEHWDNNDGKNYTLQTESAYTPSNTISLPHDCDLNEMRFY